MKKKIFNLIILDESGSMQSIRKEAVDSVNETVQTIRKAQRKHEEQAHYVTLVTFNDTAHTQYACVRCGSKVGERTRGLFLPTKLSLTFVYYLR